MKQRIIIAVSIVLLAGVSGANAYFLQDAYRKYQVVGAKKTVTLTTKGGVTNAKQVNVGDGQQGTEATQGRYAFEERDHSKISSEQATGKLLIASNESQGINYLLAVRLATAITSDILTPNWSLQTLSDDPMWSPGACSSKPTYFLQSKYVFIDDGKTQPTDRYNSYVVFDMLAQKFRYFGGDNFTDAQATKEKILSVVDENDQIVFYIDQSDSSGPLAGSSSFKHARGYAPGYIIRRVIDLATLHYTDYKLRFMVPADQNFNFYYTNVGTTKSERITLSSDTSDNYYSGQVHNNAIELSLTSTTAQPPSQITPPPDPLAVALSQPLSSVLSSFMPTDAPETSNQPNFDITALGSHGNVQYLVANNRQSSYSTPLIYDKTTNVLDPLTTRAVLDWTSYVALGVF